MPRRGFGGLEPYAGKLARTVLRGGGCGNVAALPDYDVVDENVCGGAAAICSFYAIVNQQTHAYSDITRRL